MTAPVAVCWGAGWDSTAAIIELVRRGIEIALITMADVGAEKNIPNRELGEEIGTYDFIPVFQEWCRKQGIVVPVVCHYEPLEATNRRYTQAVREVADRLGITLSDEQLRRLSRIYGNMVSNETLPGIAFGRKSCSMKWKVDAQEPV